MPHHVQRHSDQHVALQGSQGAEGRWLRLTVIVLTVTQARTPHSHRFGCTLISQTAVQMTGSKVPSEGPVR